MILTPNHNKSSLQILEAKIEELSEHVQHVRACNSEFLLLASKMLTYISDRSVKDKFIDEIAELTFERYK